MLVLGCVAGAVTFGVGHLLRRRARLTRRHERGCEPRTPTLVSSSPGARSRCAQRHPWIFSGAMRRVDGDAARRRDGGVRQPPMAQPLAPRGVFAALADPRARLVVRSGDDRRRRLHSRDRVRRGLRGARALMLDAGTMRSRSCMRESDGLPGVVADRYGDVVVLQLLVGGRRGVARRHRRRRWRATGRSVRLRALRCRGAHARRTRAARGRRCTDACRDRSHRARRASPTRVDVAAGQKTGFYLDQRDNRRAWARIAPRPRVLNAFCYTGGFTLAALAGGAAGVTVDRQLARRARTGAREPRAAIPRCRRVARDWLEADVFTELRRLRNEARRFDLIVLDPPKFAPTAAHAERAARAYKDINLLALKLLRARAACSRRSPARAASPRPLPEDRRGRGAGCERRRRDRRALDRERRPSGRARLPRGRIPEGPAAAQGLNDEGRRAGVPAHAA